MLCAIGIAAAVGVATRPRLQRPDWRRRRAGARDRARRPARERAILIQHYRDLLPLSLYVPGLSFMSRRGARVASSTWSRSPRHAFICAGGARPATCRPPRMQASYAIPGFHAVGRRQFAQFTVLRLVADAPALVTPHRVARALTTTRFADDELLLQR